MAVSPTSADGIFHVDFHPDRLLVVYLVDVAADVDFGGGVEPPLVGRIEEPGNRALEPVNPDGHLQV